MRHKCFVVISAAVVIFFTDLGSASAEAGKCVFQTSSMTFAGEPAEQARCLLSPVGKLASVGDPLQQLPSTLAQLIGNPVGLTSEAIGAHLQSVGLSENAVGGDLSDRISETSGGHSAQYFVIHDTSSPFFGPRAFPSDLDRNAIVNSLAGYQHPTDAKAHVFVNRKGDVYVGHDLSVPWRATKLELRFAGTPSRGRFIHIELVQPRRSDPNLGPGNDAIAPNPGFTEAQYRRLAELYVAASLRAGTWLIPAYHAVLDSGFVGGHDDPQNFDLDAWDAALGALLAEFER